MADDILSPLEIAKFGATKYAELLATVAPERAIVAGLADLAGPEAFALLFEAYRDHVQAETAAEKDAAHKKIMQAWPAVIMGIVVGQQRPRQ